MKTYHILNTYPLLQSQKYPYIPHEENKADVKRVFKLAYADLMKEQSSKYLKHANNEYNNN